MDFYASEFEPITPKSPKPAMAVLTGPTRSCISWANVKTSKLSRPTRRYVVICSAKLTIYPNDTARNHILSIPITGASLILTSIRNECLFRTSSHRLWIQWPSESLLRACRAAFEFSNRLIDDYYKLVPHRQLGKGRNSHVIFAFDTSNGDHAAVKVMNKDKARTTDREFAEKEVLIRMTVQHPCVVQTLDIFETPLDLFIVMELMPGSSLDRKMSKLGCPIDEIDARVIMRRLFAALAHLHARNIVHRNVKPQNIFLDVADDFNWPQTTKLSDFSLACVLDDPDCRKQIVGTPEFLAPEASTMTMTSDGAREVVFGVEMDMWACGVTLYNLLSGHLPFEGDTPAEVFKRSKRGKVRFGHAFASISYEGMSLIRALLNPDRRKRLTAETVLLHPWFSPLIRVDDDDDCSEDETGKHVRNDQLDDVGGDDSGFDVMELSDGIKRLRAAATAIIMLIRLGKQICGISDRNRSTDKKFQFKVSSVNIAPVRKSNWDFTAVDGHDHVWGETEPESVEVALRDGIGKLVFGTALSRVSTGSTVKSRSSAGTDCASRAGYSDTNCGVKDGGVTDCYERENVEGECLGEGASQRIIEEEEMVQGLERGRWRARSR